MVRETEYDIGVDQCRKFVKGTASFRIGNWSGKNIVVESMDSAETERTTPASSGDWTTVSGVPNGTIYLYLSSVAGGGTARFKVSDW